MSKEYLLIRAADKIRQGLEPSPEEQLAMWHSIRHPTGKDLEWARREAAKLGLI